MMKLDQTFIAIRERTTLEIFDLAIQVVRWHFAKLLGLLVLGALPWTIANWFFLQWILQAGEQGESTFGFYWMMMILVISQAQAGTSMITYYLGQAMFIEEMTLTQILRDSFLKAPFFWWLHGGVRMVLPIMGVAFLTWSGGWPTLTGFSLFAALLASFAMLIRALRPFVSEIFLLEKTPVRSERPNRINFAKRSSNLHRHAGSELFHRFLVGCLFYPLIFLSTYSGLTLIDSALVLQAGFEFPLRSLYWVAALWLTAGFAAVVRFLSYIDIRIRQEGWAVELKMRAEGMRLSGVAPR
jgi:hypothetical protein